MLFATAWNFPLACESVKLEISSRPLNSLKSAEIAEVKQIIGNRSINVLTLSVGGNDVGFVSEVESLIANTATGSPSLASIQSSVNAGLKSEFRAGQGDQGARCRQGPDHRLPRPDTQPGWSRLGDPRAAHEPR